MDILALNKNAWDHIGVGLASPYLAHEKFASLFNLFCSLLPPAAAVLDLGCGTGVPCTRELVNRGLAVTGIDISETMIRAARENVPSARYLISSITDIDFEEQFEGVFAAYTMISLDLFNFSIAAAKAVRSLKPGGVIFLGVNEPKDRCRAADAACYQELNGARIYIRPYTEEEIREVFAPLGMQVIIVEREFIHSQEYGVEHTLLMLMKKQ